jgi:hypothetical protein
LLPLLISNSMGFLCTLIKACLSQVPAGSVSYGAWVGATKPCQSVGVCPIERAVMVFLVGYLCSMICSLHSYKILSWNVRGLNNTVRQEEVIQTISLARPDVVCIQETKMEDISVTTVRNSLGHDYETNFFFQPAIGTRGGGGYSAWPCHL